jgi:hypothetical protein
LNFLAQLNQEYEEEKTPLLIDINGLSWEEVIKCSKKLLNLKVHLEAWN